MFEPWAEFLGFSEQVHGWVKKLIPTSEKGLCKGLSVVCSDTWRGYTGIAAKGYVHRLVKHGRDSYVSNGNHINGLGLPKTKTGCQRRNSTNRSPFLPWRIRLEIQQPSS